MDRQTDRKTQVGVEVTNDNASNLDSHGKISSLNCEAPQWCIASVRHS